ncbi:MAG: EscT/YscT/HrcT family type III secretion system export apparatus protein [Desulfobacteraceae bacterium]|nr:EscT/YscT/HrcT family type III secretion system export apparatus protein [Desulfobacteraceae bacterium]
MLDFLSGITQNVLVNLLILIARPIAFFNVSPLLGKQVVMARVRQSFIVSIVLILYPLVEGQVDARDLQHSWIAAIVAKELFIGVLLGYAVGLIFWIGHGVGFLIDNQRGASIASAFVEMLEEQGSPLATMMLLTMITLMFCSGVFLSLLSMIYETYRIWPVFSFFPKLEPQSIVLFIKHFDNLVYQTVLLASPVLIACFTAEFSMGIMNRFAPQLNVFFLSMPIKCAIALTVLIVYTQFLFYYFKVNFSNLSLFLKPLNEIFQ